MMKNMNYINEKKCLKRAQYYNIKVNLSALWKL